jgi:hypothetical protein
MKKVVLLAVVLALCMSAYAEVLVYKFDASYKLINYTDPNRTVAEKNRTEKIQAYVVFDINSDTPLNVIQMDAGNKPTAILFGKSKDKTIGKWKKTIGGDDPNSAVLIMTAASRVFGIQTFNTYHVENKSEQRTSVIFTLIDEPNGVQPFAIIADMTGKAKKTGHDLFPETIYLPWHLSGITSVTSGDATTETFVTGQASSGKARLDFPRVDSAVNHDWDVAQTIANIETSDTLQGYDDLGSMPIPLP